MTSCCRLFGCRHARESTGHRKVITGGKHDPDTARHHTMMPVDTIKIGKLIGRGLGDLPSLSADFAIHGYPPPHPFALRLP
jgi:hypothetical protein